MKKELFGVKLAVVTYFLFMGLLLFVNFQSETSNSYFKPAVGGMESLTGAVVYDEEPTIVEDQDPMLEDYELMKHVMFNTRESYVIRFDKDPILLKQQDLEQGGSTIQEVEDYTSEVRAQHAQAKLDIVGIINPVSESGIQSLDINEFIILESEKIFNGIVLNATFEEIELIAQLPYIANIEKEKTYQIDLMDSVPLINADEVWGLNDSTGKPITGENITIAILDTGVDYTHTDFGSCTNATFLAGNCDKVIDGYDFVNNDADPMDDNGHGTHVAATAAGNGTLLGVAPGASIISYKVCNSGGSCSWTWIFKAINHSIDPNQDEDYSDHYDIMSLSLGGLGSPDNELSLLVDTAVELGIVATISAGNSGPSEGTIGSPGTSRKAITVGASTKTDGIASFSSRGPTIIGTLKPDIVAPGYKICAAQWQDAWTGSECVDMDHVAISGTSMAAPHVAGAAALIIQAHRNWTPNEVKYALRNTAVDLDLGLTTQGHGRIDIFAAVNKTNPPCIAEFNTYNLEAEVAGFFNINGTAKCRNSSDFSNFTIYYGSGDSVEDNNITLLSATGDPEQVPELNYTFSGEENWYASINIPALADVQRAEIKITGVNASNGLPLSPKLDITDNDIIDWIGYHNAVSQPTFTSNKYLAMGGSLTRREVAQSFIWEGEDPETVAIYIRKAGESLMGVTLEIHNGTDDVWDKSLKSSVVKFNNMPDEGWVNFDVSGVNLTNGSRYWIVLSMEDQFESTQYYFYYATDDLYPDGRIRYNSTSGSLGGLLTSDLAFKIMDGDYFEGSEIVAGFERELNDYLEHCNPDLNNTCSIPIKVTTTNGTIILSDIFVSYQGGTTTEPIVLTPVISSTIMKDDEHIVMGDVRTIPDGRYALVMILRGDNTVVKDYMFVTVNNYDIILPEGGYLIKNGINVTGASKSQDIDFENYTLEYKNDVDGIWHQIKYSTETIFNGTLGFFNATDLGDGNYTIKLTIYYTSMPDTPGIEEVRVKVDKGLQDGWPQETDFVMYSSPKVADVDNDGDLEVIVATSRNYNIYTIGGDYNSLDRSVYIFNHDGTIMPGWPKPTGITWGPSVTVADLDNDGDLEIIHIDTERKGIVAWHHNGSVVEGWPFSTTYTVYSFPSVSDLDNDGYKEVVFTTGRSWDWDKMYVLNHNGSIKWETDPGVVRSSYRLSYPAIADVDKDGYKEILISSSNRIYDPGHLYLFKHNGSVMPGWPHNFTAYDEEIFSATMADLDGDMDQEIIFFQRGTGIIALHHDGTSVNGWPINPGGAWFLNFVTADLDKDNDLEIVAVPFLYGGWPASQVYAFEGDGSNFTGFPIPIPYNVLHMRPTVGDIDGDGEYEILVISSAGESRDGGWFNIGGVYAYNVDNQGITPGFPKYMVAPYTTSKAQECAPVITDLDQDGDVEIITTVGYYTNRMPLGVYNGGRVVVWDLNSTYDESMVEWGMFYNNIQNTNSYVDVDFDNVGLDDNCQFVSNPLQTDLDSDGVGDVCDNLVGNGTTIESNVELNITIGNNTNFTGEFTGSLDVVIAVNDTPLIEFEHDFNQQGLNLFFSVEHNVSDNNTYIIITGLDITGTKTVYIQKTTNTSNAVCILDQDNVTLVQVKSSCSDLRCPDSSLGYTCVVENDTFVISGLTHSGVIENYVAPSPPGGGSSGGSGGSGGSGTVVGASLPELGEEYVPLTEPPKELETDKEQSDEPTQPTDQPLAEQETSELLDKQSAMPTFQFPINYKKFSELVPVVVSAFLFSMILVFRRKPTSIKKKREKIKPVHLNLKKTIKKSMSISKHTPAVKQSSKHLSELDKIHNEIKEIEESIEGIRGRSR